jgi:DNA-binding NarL/FixJ family response regulator
MPPTRPRLLLADDHQELLREVEQLMAGEFEVVGTVSDGAALVSAAGALKPDVVVTDIRMPKLSGIEASTTILQRRDCKAVVILTMYDDAYLVKNALDAGIGGYVLKMAAGEELIAAVHEALRGGVFVSKRLRFNRL